MSTVRWLPAYDARNPDRDGTHAAVKVIQGRGEWIPLEIAPNAPRRGITDPEKIAAELVGYTAKVSYKITKDEVIVEKRRELQRYRKDLVVSLGGRINAEALEALAGKDWLGLGGLTAAHIRRWRREGQPSSQPRYRDGSPDRVEERDGKTYDVYVVPEGQKMFVKSPIGDAAASMPLTKADMNELREELEERYEALHADVRATLAVVLERFPDSKAVAHAVDEFLDGTLRD